MSDQEHRVTHQATSHASATVRRFTDCVGDQWTVYCIRPPSLLAGVITLLPHEERRNGWLLFESSEGERRRLAPFPADWAVVSDFELERWCMRATRIEDLPNRRAGER